MNTTTILLVGALMGYCGSSPNRILIQEWLKKKKVIPLDSKEPGRDPDPGPDDGPKPFGPFSLTAIATISGAVLILGFYTGLEADLSSSMLVSFAGAALLSELSSILFKSKN